MKETPFENMARRIAELERCQANMSRKVRVKEYKAGKVIVEDDTGFESTEVQQASVASGEWTIDAPASVGTQGVLLSPDGDPANGVFIPMLPTNQDENSSTELGTLRLRGPDGVEITIKGGVATLNCDVELGGPGGQKVARISDHVDVGSGSSAGLWPIVEGSSRVTAVD